MGGYVCVAVAAASAAVFARIVAPTTARCMAVANEPNITFDN